MMQPLFETDRYVVIYDYTHGVGAVIRRRDDYDSLLITGQEMVDLKYSLTNIKKNAASDRDYYRVANSVLAEYIVED